MNNQRPPFSVSTNEECIPAPGNIILFGLSVEDMTRFEICSEWENSFGYGAEQTVS